MQIILYDTEFTAWEGSQERNWSLHWEYKEIIQFSAKKLHLTALNFDLIDEFHTFVKPIKNVQLSNYIMELTKINQDQIEQGLSAQQLFAEIHQFSENFEVPMYSWGNDLHVLEETAHIHNICLKHLNSCDLRPIFEQFSINTNVSSGQLFKNFDIDLSIQEHNALDDTLSLYESLKQLHKQNPKKLVTLFTDEIP